jgi:hypothetical protein
MRCRKVAKELPAYLANEVSERARSRIEAHLKHCALCAAEVRALEQTDRLLDTCGEVEPRRDLVGVVMQRIEHEQETIPAFKRFLISLNERRPKLQYAAANILLIVALGFMVYNYHVRRRARVQEPRSAESSDYRIPLTGQDVEKLNLEIEQARAAEAGADELGDPERYPEVMPVDAPVILRPGPDGTLLIEPASDQAEESSGD